MATSPVPYPEKKLGQAEPIYRAGFGKGVAETAKEWEEGGVGWRKLLLESVFLASARWTLSFFHPCNVHPRWTTPKNNPSLSRRFYSIPLARQWIEEDSQGDGGSRESNRFHPWPNTRLIPVTICFFFLSSRSVKGKTSGKRRRRKTANRGGGEGRIGKGREILRRSERRWRVRERGRRAAISRSTGNARGNEARPARTSGTWTFLRPRERLFLFFLFSFFSRFIVRNFLAFSRQPGKEGGGTVARLFRRPGPLWTNLLFVVASESDDSLWLLRR